MENNLRGNLFPGEIQKTANTVRGSMIRLGAREIIEIAVANGCEETSLVDVKNITKLNDIATKCITLKSADGILLGSEYWTTKSCGKMNNYRVNYFRNKDDGNHYFSTVTPTNIKGFYQKLMHYFHSI